MNIEDLRYTASLAHLNLNEQELAEAFPAFEQMMGYFSAMQAADKDTDFFNTSITGDSVCRVVQADHFRTDILHCSDEAAELHEKILANAGQRKGRFLVIPNVL